MTDKADESTRSAREGGEQPAPTVPSGQAGDQLPSTPSRDEADVAAQIAQLTREVQSLRQKQEELPDTVERLVQGTKDRRFRQLEGIDPDMLAAFKGYLDQFDGNFERAARELQVDLLLQRGADSEPTARGSAGSGSVASGQDLAEVSADILTKAGIAFNDPGYEAFVSENAGTRFTREAWRDAVESWAFKRLRQGGAPSGAVVGERGSPVQSANLRQQYDKEAEALRGTRNYAALTLLKSKYRKLGLDV